MAWGWPPVLISKTLLAQSHPFVYVLSRAVATGTCKTLTIYYLNLYRKGLSTATLVDAAGVLPRSTLPGTPTHLRAAWGIALKGQLLLPSSLALAAREVPPPGGYAPRTHSGSPQSVSDWHGSTDLSITYTLSQGVTNSGTNHAAESPVGWGWGPPPAETTSLLSSFRSPTCLPSFSFAWELSLNTELAQESPSQPRESNLRHSQTCKLRITIPFYT